MKITRLMGFVLAGGLLFTAATAAAEAGAEAAKELALRKVMKELGSNMQAVAGGISMEDWPLIEKTAPLIADHQQPPLTEKLRIIAFMGTDMGKFKGYDTKVHEAADSLEQAEKAKDGEAVIAAFNAVQTACYGCHRDFRKQFLQHFYGPR